MLAWNRQVFLLINAPLHPAAGLVFVADILAFSPVAVVPVLLVLLWVRGSPPWRGGLLAAAAGAMAGLGLNQLLGLLWYEPRPFMIGLGHSFAQHIADNSFPSDHATLTWAVGMGLVATGAARRWGMAACLFGMPIAWSRVYLGLHFPVDMATSLLVGVASAALAAGIRGPIDRWVMPLAGASYEAALTGLHLPAQLFPRRLESNAAHRRMR